MRRKCTSCAFYRNKQRQYKNVPQEYWYDGWCRYYDEDRDKKEFACENYKRLKMGNWRLYDLGDL